jgi:hypothetical protein
VNRSPGLRFLSPLTAILILSIIAFVVYVKAWPSAPYTATDTGGYVDAARGLAEGRVDHPAFRTPGYPLLLVATHGPSRSLFLAQLLLQISAVVLVCLTLRRLGASDTLVVLAGLVGLLPPFVQTAAWTLTETLTQFMLVAAVASLERFFEGGRRAWLLLASLALAYAGITRPTFQLGAVVLGLVLALVSRWVGSREFSAREFGLLLAGTVVFVGGYVLFNEARFGVPGTTSTLGFNLANRCPELYTEIPDPVTRRLLVQARNEAYVEGTPVEWAHYHAPLTRELGKTQEEIEPWLRKQFVRTILSHPVQYGQIVAASLARFWFPVTGKLPLLGEKHLRPGWYALHALLMLVLAVEASLFPTWLVATWTGVRWDTRTREAWILWAMCATLVLYNALISCFLETGETRYRTSTELLMLMAAGAGLVAVRGLVATLSAAAGKLSRLRVGGD